MSLPSVLSSLWLLVILAVIGINTFPSEAADTHCARKMYDALDLICTYGSQTRLKKSVEPVDNYLNTEGLNVMAIEDFPTNSRFGRRSLENSQRRRQQAIATECCEKQCTMGELLRFCNNY